MNLARIVATAALAGALFTLGLVSIAEGIASSKRELLLRRTTWIGRVWAEHQLLILAALGCALLVLLLAEKR